MPFFNELKEGERYANSRPYFHPLAIERAKKAAGLDDVLPLGLDVACGTGHSARALKSISNQVVAMDISWNMLANVEQDDDVHYIQARAESIPFPAGSMPVMSCALAFHWFDRDQFLREAWRVLIPDGWLLVYNNGFTGMMRENPAFQEWSQIEYQERFPTPPRNSTPLTPESAKASGFSLAEEERYQNEVSFTPESLVAYLATQTNVMAAIGEGRESYNSATQWLEEQVRPFFADEYATFIFSTNAWYLKKMKKI